MPFICLIPWAGYFKGVDMDSVSEAVKSDLRAEYDEFVNAEDTRTRNFVIFDEGRIEITNTLFRVTETPEFKRWFGDSKVVDENGEPLVVYHSTPATFDIFDTEINGGSHFGTAAAADQANKFAKAIRYSIEEDDGRFYVIPDNGDQEGKDIADFGSRKEAQAFIKTQPARTPLMKIYLSIQNPKRVDDAGMSQAWEYERQRAISEGYDGLVYQNQVEDKGKDSYVAFYPSQIKSATGNNGDFSLDNNNIMFRVDDDFGVEVPEQAMRPWRSSLRDMVDRFRFQHQDKLIDLKRIQEEVDPADAANAYQKASIWEGKAGERLNDFDENRIQPLLQAIADSGVDWDTIGRWLVARHAREANAYLAEINPDMVGEDRYRLSGMSDEEAQQTLDENSNHRGLWAVGDMIDTINRERVDMLIEEGLITPEEAAKWRARYQYYVPLFREEAPGASNRMPGRGQGFNISGKESRMRTGSAHWTPGKIVANVLAQYQSSVVRAEKNKVGVALLRFVRQHPDPNFWNIDTERTIKTVRNGKVIEVPRGKDASHELSVKVDGIQHYISFNQDNERAMRLVTGMKNLQAAEMGSVMRAMATATRFLSTINTSWNPEFVISNFTRDIQTAAYNLSDTDIASMRGKVMTDVPAAIKGIKQALFDKDFEGEWAQHWEDFRQHGGKTGWIDLHDDILKQETNLKEMAERLAEGKPSRDLLTRFLKSVENANTVVENGVRLAAYKNALDAGLSKDKAAVLAKDLTVNFNRKGARGAHVNALYMFYNASMQGNIRMIQAMVNSKHGRNLALATIGFAVLLDMINRSLSGDDDDDQNIYDAMPDYVKDHNLIVMGEKEPIVKIPLPWGYNILHTIGQVIGEGLTGDGFSPVDSASRVAMAFINAFNPIGGGTLAQIITPTVADPLVMMAENKTFSGAPLKPEHTYDSKAPTPEYLMHWSTAREGSQAFAKWLNDLSGGNEIRPGFINVSPEWIDLVYDTFTGGAGRTAANFLDTAARAVSGEEMPADNIPFLRRVTGYDSSFGVKTRYYEWTKGVAYAKAEAKGLRGADLAEARKNPEFRLIPLYTATEKKLVAMRKLRRDMVKHNASQEKIDNLDERIRVVMARFNNAYSESVLN